MKIFELVKKLEEIRDEHGDLELYVEGENWAESLNAVDIQAGGVNSDNMHTSVLLHKGRRSDNPANNQPSKNMTTNNEKHAASDLSASAGYGWVKNSKAPDDTRRYLLAVDDGIGPRRVGFGWRKWKSEEQISDWWETDQGLVHDSIITHYAVPIPLP